MSKSHQNYSEYFPRLNLNYLQTYSKRWVDKFKEKKITIKSIMLYRYSNKYKWSKYAKYGLLFVVDKKVSEKDYNKFEAKLANYSIDDADDQKDIDEFADELADELAIDRNFDEVYNEKPENNYLSEWQFLSKISGEKMPREIMTNEPHWVLFPVKDFPSTAFQDISNETTKLDHDEFIRRLKVYYETDEQIKIQIQGKNAMPYLYSYFDFRNSSTRQWKTFIKIIHNPPHTFYLVPDKQRKRIAAINEKLTYFFRTHPDFSLHLPEDYKIYEKCSKEVDRKYRFKFQVVSYGKSTLEAKYESFPKKKLIDEICKLSEDYQKHINKVVINKKKHKILKNALETQINVASSIALTKKWLNEKDIKDIIQQGKETHVYNPHENEEDREPN